LPVLPLSVYKEDFKVLVLPDPLIPLTLVARLKAAMVVEALVVLLLRGVDQ
jgi:hypothetical protein